MSVLSFRQLLAGSAFVIATSTATMHLSSKHSLTSEEQKPKSIQPQRSEEVEDQPIPDKKAPFSQQGKQRVA